MVEHRQDPRLDELRKLIASNTSVFLSASGIDLLFQTYIVDLANDYIYLKNTVPMDYISAVRSSSDYALRCQMTKYLSDSIETDGVHILFPVEKSRTITETRKTQRYAFDPKENVVLKVTNPFDRITELTKSIMDMSANGLSIRTNIQSKLFQPGIRFDGLRVLIDGELYSEKSGEVVYTKNFISGDGQLLTQVGFRFAD